MANRSETLSTQREKHWGSNQEEMNRVSLIFLLLFQDQISNNYFVLNRALGETAVVVCDQIQSLRVDSQRTKVYSPIHTSVGFSFRREIQDQLELQLSAERCTHKTSGICMRDVKCVHIHTCENFFSVRITRKGKRLQTWEKHELRALVSIWTAGLGIT